MIRVLVGVGGSLRSVVWGNRCYLISIFNKLKTKIMKKETLLASMPKMVLVTVLIVCVGTVMGLMGYALTKKQTRTEAPDKIVEENQKEELIISCETDSDCESYFSYNTCEIFCANKDEENQRILNGFNKTCDPTLWFATRPECECVDNECRQVVGERSYNFLEKKCDGDSCCLDSLEYMKENNYKETKRSSQPEEKHICPSGFKVGRLNCYTFLKWCEPIEEKYCFDEQNNHREIGETWLESSTTFMECNEFGKVVNSYVLSCENEKLVISNYFGFDDDRTTPSLPFHIATDTSLRYTWTIDSNKYTESSGGPTGVFASCENGKATMFSFGGMNQMFYSKVFFDGNYKIRISCLDSTLEGFYRKDDLENFTISKYEDGKKLVESKTLENGKKICQEIKERYQELEGTVMDTSDWQTYWNKEFELEFKYPLTWNRIDKYEGYAIAFNPDNNTNILVSIQDYDTELSVEEWVISGMEKGMGSPVISRKNEVINGLEMFRLIAWDGNEFERVFILKDNKLVVFLFAYTIRDTKVEESVYYSGFEKILSSFKFTEN